MAFYAAQEQVAPGACMMMRELLNSWQPMALYHAHTLPDGFNAIVPVLTKMKAKIEVDELDHTTFTYIYEDNVGEEKGLAVAANATHGVDGFIVREVVRRCNYDQETLLTINEWIDRMPCKHNPATPHTMEQTANAHGFLSLRGVEFIQSPEDLEQFSLRYLTNISYLISQVLKKPSFPILTVHDEFKCHANHMDELRAVYQEVLAELADSRVGEQIIGELRMDPDYKLEKLSTDLSEKIMEGEYFLS